MPLSQGIKSDSEGRWGGRKIGKNLQLTKQREQSQAGLNSAES